MLNYRIQGRFSHQFPVNSLHCEHKGHLWAYHLCVIRVRQNWATEPNIYISYVSCFHCFCDEDKLAQMEIYVLKYFLYQLPPDIYIWILSAIMREVQRHGLWPRELSSSSQQIFPSCDWPQWSDTPQEEGGLLGMCLCLVSLKLLHLFLQALAIAWILMMIYLNMSSTLFLQLHEF